MAEVEPEPVGADPRTFLLHVGAEDLPQRPVQDVGGGVVAADPVAAGPRRAGRLTGSPAAIPPPPVAVGDPPPPAGAIWVPDPAGAPASPPTPRAPPPAP